MELGGGNLRVDNGGGFVFESQGNLVRCANLEIHGEVKLRREERQLGGHRDGIEAVIVEGDDDRSVELAWIDDRTMAIRSIGGKIRIRRQGREVAVADMTFQLKGDAEELRTSCCDGQVPVNAEDRYGVYVNRWQSWSFCGTVLDGERLPPPATPRISNKGFHDGGVPGNRFTSSRFKRRTKISDMFLLCGRPKHPMLFAGFLSQANHFGSVKVDPRAGRLLLRVRFDGSPMQWTDWAIIQFPPETDPFGAYAKMVADVNSVRDLPEIPTGWCSWYHYYEKINRENILQQTKHLIDLRREIPLRVIQVDDGWQPAWGDWYPNEKFPGGMQEVAEEIRKAGFVPGLWLAPFAADKFSDVVAEHPKWCLRLRSGRLANSGNCGKWFCGLDVTNDQVIEHAVSAVKRAVDWGFKYLKLDFLYAGVLHGGVASNKTATRASALRRALLAIREAVGNDVFLVGCGCPMGSGIGIFDAMRIGCDVGPKWLPDLSWDRWNLPSVRTALRNCITRSWMDQRWWINDPDCVLLRSTTSLTDPELLTIATTVALAGGMFMLSDALEAVPAARIRIAKVITPPAPKTYPLQLPDLLRKEMPSVIYTYIDLPHGDHVCLVACYNWDIIIQNDTLSIADLGFSDCSVHCIEFWTSAYTLLAPNASIALNLNPRHCYLFALRKVNPGGDPIVYLGSNIHFTCGLELVHMSTSTDSATLRLEIGQDTEGFVILRLPWAPQSSGDAAKDLPPEQVDDNIWRVHVAVKVEGSTLTITNIN